MNTRTYKPRDTFRKPEPLGALLKAARMDKGFTRKEVAEKAAITASSLVKYERWGLDGEGQCPPADKLAKLCSVLKIDPQAALLGSLNDQEYSRYQYHDFDILNGHPMIVWLEGQYAKTLRDCNVLRSGLELLIDIIDPIDKKLSPSQSWLLQELYETKERHENFEARMVRIGTFYFDVWRDMYLPSTDRGETNWFYDINVIVDFENLSDEEVSARMTLNRVSLQKTISRISESLPPSQLNEIIEVLEWTRDHNTDEKWIAEMALKFDLSDRYKKNGSLMNAGIEIRKAREDFLKTVDKYITE